MKNLLSVEQAARLLMEAALSQPQPERQTIDIASACGRILAQDILAPMDVPPAANSAMDGYALAAMDGTPGSTLPVSQTIAAGTAPRPLPFGSAARILTGAEIPPGADSVIIQENVTRDGDRITLNAKVQPGANIRPRGQDIAKGDLVLSGGRYLTPQDIGLLASVGIAEVSVCQPLRVALLSTGDELVAPGSPLQAGQIYNSNQPMLAALVTSLGGEVVLQQQVKDDYQATCEALSHAAAVADVILTCGGVSVGDEDHVKPAVQALGELDLWKVAMKPGKPLAFGRVAKTPFIGLPGNPVSAWVTFQLMVRPALLVMAGGQQKPLLSVRQQALFERMHPGGRDEYARGRMSSSGVELFAQQSSGVLSSVAWADCLVRLPAGEVIERGQWVDVLPLAQWCC
ncbi:gephyrin-like molybdotransferase Glp [Gilvimarinus sp. DA14]|uniref:molybdopterin molybdotransferase MoeA n=1 Tax=Gilvimarinus sp. DA14 TaxID=2956798 RepID=UPI0020B72B2F|nr:gephyrin-like molybdotransferase Glp [Gilvimarinus sp. DA14]UTF58827.1 molybdopterin molybdotransferase MoeA [Gilvimarinus sp. DA14]